MPHPGKAGLLVAYEKKRKEMRVSLSTDSRAKTLCGANT